MGQASVSKVETSKHFGIDIVDTGDAVIFNTVNGGILEIDDVNQLLELNYLISSVLRDLYAGEQCKDTLTSSSPAQTSQNTPDRSITTASATL